MSRQAYMAKPYSGIRFPVSKILTGFRSMSTAEEQLMDDYEKKIFGILKESFQPKNLQVKDVSGGCGSMFAILVESEKFKGIPMIKQHRLVNEVLKDEISKWHGIQLKTKSI
ncbi:uncharacterized protein AC631_04730 [Debaryomyces fabryi]|uniref:Bola-like protein n=1 Tax=Debaryomyces fabryi TaxID=58627 RepID=A0A0V1PTE0_9ASCO|nr:uncharacterized protein AC631_04730 [Debaryomyces fabryi]KRZ99511.1 hypothetical protein AC631_04730 [Debaryomyces fabryi]